MTQPNSACVCQSVYLLLMITHHHPHATPAPGRLCSGHYYMKSIPWESWFSGSGTKSWFDVYQLAPKYTPKNNNIQQTTLAVTVSCLLLINWTGGLGKNWSPIKRVYRASFALNLAPPWFSTFPVFLSALNSSPSISSSKVQNWVLF